MYQEPERRGVFTAALPRDLSGRTPTSNVGDQLDDGGGSLACPPAVPRRWLRLAVVLLLMLLTTSFTAFHSVQASASAPIPSARLATEDPDADPSTDSADADSSDSDSDSDSADAKLGNPRTSISKARSKARQPGGSKLGGSKRSGRERGQSKAGSPRTSISKVGAGRPGSPKLGGSKPADDASKSGMSDASVKTVKTRASANSPAPGNLSSVTPSRSGDARRVNLGPPNLSAVAPPAPGNALEVTPAPPTLPRGEVPSPLEPSNLRTWAALAGLAGLGLLLLLSAAALLGAQFARRDMRQAEVRPQDRS